MSPRSLVLAGAALAVSATLAAWRLRPSAENSAPPARLTAAADGAADAGAAREVFQRAFWRRPEAGDRILRAESRPSDGETSGAAPAVMRWFLAVEPGPALARALREENPFSLRPVVPAPVADAPAWFPRDLDGFTMHAGSGPAARILLTSGDGRRLYVAGTSRAFAPPVAEPPAPAASLAHQPPPGRLPATPPPNPNVP